MEDVRDTDPGSTKLARSGQCGTDRTRRSLLVTRRPFLALVRGNDKKKKPTRGFFFFRTLFDDG